MADRKWIKLGLFAVAIIPLVLYLFVVTQRLGFAFDLEWAEGAALNQVNRILAGDRLYTEPTIEFAPLVYTPFYYYVSAAAGLLVGNELLGLRLVSLGSSLGSAVIIGCLVSKEMKSFYTGWLGAALYLACFDLCSGFFDLARVDSLYILILLLIVLLLRNAHTRLVFAAAGLLTALGFYTKQSTIIAIAPLLAYFGVIHWQRTWTFLLGTVLGIVIPLLALNRVTSGWFSYYIFHLPSQHGYSLVDAVYFWVGEIFRPFGIAVGFMVFYWLVNPPLGNFFDNLKKPVNLPRNSIFPNHETRSKSLVQPEIFYLLFALGAFMAAWITRSSNGGGSNNLMSAYAAIAIVFGLGFQSIVKWIDKKDFSQGHGIILVSGLVFIQFAGLIYNPFNYIPTSRDREINQALITVIEDAEGDVLIPYRSHLPGLTGKKVQIHVVSLFELTDYFHGEIQEQGLTIIDEIRQKICHQKYSVIILDQPIPWFEPQIQAAYKKMELLDRSYDGGQSEQMNWQNGYKNIYVPDENRSVGKNDCVK